ncbi:hypothetical protein [Thermomonas flagellata]|uniref:hypothetical protein n=1 Tax=Thermomonas flagellata TaxID=2888524 RepID=UPI001F04CCA3|nr:hypothetical protein [Thermomonas flagellata]
MRTIVQTLHGEAVRLSDSPLAQGGEAAVYEVPQYPSVVVKLYHPQVLDKRRNSLRAKIEAMCTDPALAGFKQHSRMTWPRFSVFDERKQWRGYAMKKAAGVRMTVLAHAMAYHEHFPDLDRPALLAYLLNLLSTMQELHAAGVRLGDYNPANFLCQPDGREVTLIDCDSWQVQAAGRTFHCPVAAPEMLPPELLGKDLARTHRTLESEQFSLAILIFKVLMLGRHPFDVVGGESPVANIRQGHFPYGIGGGGIPKGAWFNIWSHLPFRLKEQFVRTFRDGSRDPTERTTVPEWIQLLSLYQREITRGWHAAEIKPPAPKKSDYRGSQSAPQPLSA